MLERTWGSELFCTSMWRVLMEVGRRLSLVDDLSETLVGYPFFSGHRPEKVPAALALQLLETPQEPGPPLPCGFPIATPGSGMVNAIDQPSFVEREASPRDGQYIGQGDGVPGQPEL
jgi:hypothetical protein